MTGNSTRRHQHCETSEILAILRGAELRPTRQRMALGKLLFLGEDRHLTAESLYDEARQQGFEVSLATVYNTLHQFTEAGLLRSIAIDTSKTYFDTNTGDHHHFYVEDGSEIFDVPADSIAVEGLPEPPEGLQIERVDVVIRLRAKR